MPAAAAAVSSPAPFVWAALSKEKDYKLLVSWNAVPLQHAGTSSPTPASSLNSIDEEKRNAHLRAISTLNSTPFTDRVLSVVPMTFFEESLCCFAWLAFFGFMLFTPLYLIYLVCLSNEALKAMQITVLLVLIGFVSPRNFKPDNCKSYLAGLMLKYFSHTAIWKENLPQDRPSIIVAPPHGVFPFGSLLACVSLPRITGLYIRGLAASALLSLPFIGPRLSALGLVDASRDNARRMLIDGWSLGISSGGISEIFETRLTQSSGGVETIILKSRGGICKLALETGAYLVPSFIFGNTLCLNVWSDSFGILRWLSRRLRVSICLFSGRFGLPIPFRVPILGVLGDPIVVPKTADPSPEMVQSLLDKLCEDIHALFETHKAAAGWEKVTLVIK